MEKDSKITINKNTKIIVPGTSYDFKSDHRLLIPFTQEDKIGFINQGGDVVVEAKYNMYYGECYKPSDLIRITVPYSYGFQRSGDKVAIYTKNLQGLVNYKGEVLKPEYDVILTSIGSRPLFTVQKEYSYGVLNFDGSNLIPYGKYDWIDGFDNGLARVLIRNQGSVGKALWGIINDKGEEVMHVEYDKIWNFYGKNLEKVTIEKGNRSYRINLNYLNGKLQKNNEIKRSETTSERYGSHYGEFAGSYAQDVEGYSDDVINDAFEGDPDAYWNID